MYEYIRDVRNIAEYEWVDPGMRACFLFTGHGSLNAFLNGRGLALSPDCRCGGGAEDWAHVLAWCPRYASVRDLGAMGVTIEADGGVNVSRVMANEENYRVFVEFAREVFGMREREQV